MISTLKNNLNPVFYSSPRSLQDLASLRLALYIWLEKFHEFYSLNMSFYIDITSMQVDTEMLTGVPFSIKKVIENNFDPLARELDTWFKNSKTVLYHLNCTQIYTRFHLVVFGGNGTVNFKQTIANFLEDMSLDDLTKFEIACVYCFEDKIDVFWPLVCDTLCIDDLRFNYNFTVYYWICRKKGELNRISVEEFECENIVQLMIDKCSWYPIWLAVEYFLNLLDPEERLREISELFEIDAKFKCALYLLPYFKASEQHHVLESKKTDILAYIVDNHKLAEFAIQAWIYIRDSITGEEFYHGVIRRLIHSRNYNTITKKYEYIYVENVLAEIWMNAPLPLKEFILNFHFSDVQSELSKYGGDLTKDLNRNIRFLLAMLIDADVSLRKKFYSENWSCWIAGVSSAHLNQLMELCLEDERSIEEFKDKLKRTVTFDKYCDSLVTRGYNDELNEFLSCFCSDEKEILDIKINLLKTSDYWVKCFCKRGNFELIQYFSDFIDNLLLNDAASRQFKEKMILSQDRLKNLYDKVYRNDFLVVEIATNLFLCEDKCLELKKMFLSTFRSRIIEGKLDGFDESDWMDFLIWCTSGDEEKKKEFMESLPIDEIFEVAVSNCSSYDPYTNHGFGSINKCSFKDLKMFLFWYFKSSSLYTDFCREKIGFYDRMEDEDVERIFSTDKDSVIFSIKRELLIDADDEKGA